MHPAILELTARGLTLWRLQAKRSHRYVLCWVMEAAGGFTMKVEASDDTDLCRSERHDSIVSVVDCADRIRTQLLHVGWQEVDNQIG